MNNKSEWNIVSRIKKIKNISNNNIIINDKNTLIMQDPVIILISNRFINQKIILLIHIHMNLMILLKMKIMKKFIV